jgi:hypothetical protein
MLRARAVRAARVGVAVGAAAGGGGVEGGAFLFAARDGEWRRMGLREIAL